MDLRSLQDGKRINYNFWPNRGNFKALLKSIIGKLKSIIGLGLRCKSVCFPSSAIFYFTSSFFTIPTHTPHLLIIAACDCSIRITCYYLTALMEYLHSSIIEYFHLFNDLSITSLDLATCRMSI